MTGRSVRDKGDKLIFDEQIEVINKGLIERNSVVTICCMP
jgi:hypothetical protein